MLKDALAKMHDAELVSVEVVREEKKLILGFQKAKAQVEYLFCNDVVAFRVNNFIFQNVVSRLIVSSDYSLNDEETLTWVKWIHSFNDTKTTIRPDAIDSYVKRIRDKELILFFIDPSWGGEVAAICKSLQHMANR